jgi:predicted PurR-regulated permease PerM
MAESKEPKGPGDRADPADAGETVEVVQLQPGDLASAAESGETVEVVQLQPGEPARNVPLVLLTIFAAIFVLDWAEVVFIPLLLGLLLSYALDPVVDRLERFAIPRSLSAAVLLLAIVGGTAAAAFSLRDEAVDLIESLPAAVQKMQQAVRREFSGPGATIEKMQKAAEELERAAQKAAPDEPPPGVTRVQIERPQLDVREYLLTNAAGAGAAIGVSLIVLFLAYFLLASGDTFRRKWVQLSGPTLTKRRITIQVMDEIRLQIQRFLGVQVLVSVIVGITSGLAFWAIGLENAAVWGVVAGVLNLVPYLGAIVTTGGTALVAFFQFGTVGMALAVGAISLVINTIEGYWLAPWLSGRVSRMNNVVVFSGLLFWGWLWSGWGLILGLPIMMVVKAICDHVEDFKPIGEFMGE